MSFHKSNPPPWFNNPSKQQTKPPSAFVFKSPRTQKQATEKPKKELKKPKVQIEGDVDNHIDTLFNRGRRNKSPDKPSEGGLDLQSLFGRKIKPSKETSLHHSFRGTFGPQTGPSSQYDTQMSQMKRLLGQWGESPQKTTPQKDAKSRVQHIFGMNKETKDTKRDIPSPALRNNSIFAQRPRQDIKTRLLALLPDSIRQNRKVVVQPHKPGLLTQIAPRISKDSNILDHDTLTSNKVENRARSLSPFAKKFLTKPTKSHEFQDLERLVADQTKETNIEDGRFTQLSNIGDIVTQSCRSESFKIKLENKDSFRLNATSITIAPQDPFRQEQQKYGKRGTYLVHQGQHLLYQSLKYPSEIQQAFLNYGECEVNCGVLGEAGIAYFIFKKKVILWSYITDSIERQADIGCNFEDQDDKIQVHKQRTSSIQIFDCEAEAVSITLVKLTNSFQARIADRNFQEGSREQLQRSLEEPPFLVIITTTQNCHFFKITSLAPKLQLRVIEDQQCSSQNERISNLTTLPHGRVVGSCIWGQLCQIELKDLINLQSFPEGTEGGFFPPTRRPSLRGHHASHLMTAKKNLESSMIGDLFRRMSHFHAQREVIQIAQDESRFYLWSVVRSKPLSSPEVRVYDLGQFGDELNHAVTITSKEIKRKMRQLQRKTKGMVREREPLHYGSEFDIAGVVPLSTSDSHSSHCIIVTCAGLQIYIQLKTTIQQKYPEQESKNQSRYVKFFKSLISCNRDSQIESSKFMREKAWKQQAFQRIKGSSFEVSALRYPPDSLNLQEIQAQQLSSNGIAVCKERYTRFECSTGSPIAHIYKVIPSPRGFMVQALVSQEQEQQVRRSKSLPQSGNSPNEHYKRVVLQFSLDDMNLSKLNLAPSSHNQKNQVAKYTQTVNKSQIISLLHDGSTEVLAASVTPLGLMGVSVELPQNLKDKVNFSREHLLLRGDVEEERDISPVNGETSLYALLTRSGLKLYVKRRPVDLVAQTLQKLASGQSVEEETDALIEAFGHIEFAGQLLAVLMNASHSLYFIHNSKGLLNQRSLNLSRNILELEKETILRSVIYDAKSHDIGRLSAFVKSGSVDCLPGLGLVLNRSVLGLIKKLFFKITEGAPRMQLNPSNNNQLGFQKDRMTGNPQTESMILALAWVLKPIWLQSVVTLHPTPSQQTFSVHSQMIESILQKLSSLRQFLQQNALQFGLTESQVALDQRNKRIEFNLANQLNTSLVSFMDYIFQGLDLLRQVAQISGPQNLGLYVFRRLPPTLLNEYKSLDFGQFLTSKQGRQFAKQIVSAQMADQMCWGNQGSDQWVEQLGSRCPFVFSRSVILVEKLHSYVLFIRRQFERDFNTRITDEPQHIRILSRRCLTHVDIAYIVWNLLHTNHTQYLEVALHIIIDALLLEKYRCLHAQGIQAKGTLLTSAVQSKERHKKKLDQFNEWISQVSHKFLSHPPIDSSGALVSPTISLEVPMIPSLETPLQNGENPRLFQIIQILSIFYLLMKDASLIKQQNNPASDSLLQQLTLNDLNQERERLIRLTVSRTPELPSLHIHLFRLTSIDLRLPLDALMLSDSAQVKDEVIHQSKSLQTVHPVRAQFVAEFLASANELEALCNYSLAVGQYDQTLRGLQTFYETPIDMVIVLEKRIHILTLSLNTLADKSKYTSLDQLGLRTKYERGWSHSKRELGIPGQEEIKEIEGMGEKPSIHREVEGMLAFLTLQNIVHSSLVASHNSGQIKGEEREEMARLIELLDRRPAQNLKELFDILEQFQMYDSIAEVIICRFLSKSALPMNLQLEDQLHKDIELAYTRFITKIFSQFPKNPASRILPRLRELKELNDNNKFKQLFPRHCILHTVELESIRTMALNPSLTTDNIFNRLVKKVKPQQQLWAVDLFLDNTRPLNDSNLTEVLMVLVESYQDIEKKENLKDSPKPRLCILGKKVLLSHLLIGSIETREQGGSWREKVENAIQGVLGDLEDERLKIMVSAKTLKEIENAQIGLVDKLEQMNQRLDSAVHIEDFS